ncbi:hypothetical protein AV530_011791 [Patagioenas fasciata monilis]|uniref:Uncharacterized protein n=1 Tax=Patagioenas fasciata monilis TaxID=372326 RepID=A0A1V4KLN4_PATFA|nr:hypothetical protein AV530_011791 [Patagioenas fasciata monilis]
MMGSEHSPGEEGGLGQATAWIHYPATCTWLAEAMLYINNNDEEWLRDTISLWIILSRKASSQLGNLAWKPHVLYM